MAAAYQAQANATIQAANINAGAARDVANAQLAGMQAQADAAIKSANSAAMGGIIGAALGANTTTEQIVRRLPVESGAATIASWELAQRWNKTINMRAQGYQDVAIEYELAGKSGSVLYKDPIWNTLYMGQKIKEGATTAARVFGIQSQANPLGIALTWDDWVEINSLKRPEDMLKVDPATAAARQAQFSAWERQMRASGKGLIVDLYKNPQLAGQSLESMAGKEAMIDPALAPLIQSMASGSGGMDIGGLTTPQKTQYTDQINKLKASGVIDANNMINGGALLQMIPKELQDAPPFEPLRKLSQNELVQLQDQYNMLMNKAPDPKLVRMNNMGFGVQRMTMLNADGTEAMSYLQGQMQMADGSSQQVFLQGTRLQEWYDMQSIVDGMGPTFPGMFAPRSNDEYNGVRRPNNAFATPSNGTPGQAAGAAQQKTDFSQNPYAQQMQLGGPARTPGVTSDESSGVGGTTTKAPTKSSSGSIGGLSQGMASGSTPSGYSGAPLAAGE